MTDEPFGGFFNRIVVVVCLLVFGIRFSSIEWSDIKDELLTSKHKQHQLSHLTYIITPDINQHPTASHELFITADKRIQLNSNDMAHVKIEGVSCVKEYLGIQNMKILITNTTGMIFK